ncbi:MAG: hypothetical protein CVU11_04080 [Bacteroidetes bacterium HGW-Bacteroidetes-6]|jgi:hypothetical protein|nr:MAG: hypothetical protein CVU11_04080 [Bacteroidetes bacterium HGW-Bacteroidetes-6]
MCFSATASFGAGAVLSIMGLASIKKAQTPVQIPFASIPFLFAVQQFSEGFLWLSLTDPSFASLREFSTYAFLFFAQIVWPFWVPFAVLKMEPIAKRKKVERILLVAGSLVSVYFIWCIFTFPVNGVIADYHIFYTFGYPPQITPWVSGVYAIATIGATMVSSIKKMWVFGLLVLLSYIVTLIFYFDFFVSVWCFFAAILTVLIFEIMRLEKKHQLD